MNDLYAVSTAQGRLCAECAMQKFGDYLEELSANDSTMTLVLQSDDWKHEVDGLCDVCGSFVGD